MDVDLLEESKDALTPIHRRHDTKTLTHSHTMTPIYAAYDTITPATITMETKIRTNTRQLPQFIEHSVDSSITISINPSMDTHRSHNVRIRNDDEDTDTPQPDRNLAQRLHQHVSSLHPSESQNPPPDVTPPQDIRQYDSQGGANIEYRDTGN